MRNWIPPSSVAAAIAPPKASTSLTKWPLPMPPIEGLQDITPSVSMLCVSSNVAQPARALASAASVPACPPPITMTSNCFGSRIRHHQNEDAHHTPKDILIDNFTREIVSRETLLFADAKAAENLAQQVICCEFACYGVERFLCLPQFFRKQFWTFKLLAGLV